MNTTNVPIPDHKKGGGYYYVKHWAKVLTFPSLSKPKLSQLYWYEGIKKKKIWRSLPLLPWIPPPISLVHNEEKINRSALCYAEVTKLLSKGTRNECRHDTFPWGRYIECQKAGWDENPFCYPQWVFFCQKPEVKASFQKKKKNRSHVTTGHCQWPWMQASC